MFSDSEQHVKQKRQQTVPKLVSRTFVFITVVAVLLLAASPAVAIVRVVVVGVVVIFLHCLQSLAIRF